MDVRVISSSGLPGDARASPTTAGASRRSLQPQLQAASPQRWCARGVPAEDRGGRAAASAVA